MTREPETPEEPRQAGDVVESDRAASADGLPLPPPVDAERRLAEDWGDAEDAAEKTEDEEQALASRIPAERGAD